MTHDEYQAARDKVHVAMFEATRTALAKVDLDKREDAEDLLKFATLCLSGGQRRLDELWEKYRASVQQKAAD